MALTATIAPLKEQLDRIEKKLDQIREPVLRVATRKESRKQQAKRQGCHPSTLWRRERRERIRQMAEGAV